MKNKSELEILRENIYILELEKVRDENLLKLQIKYTYENLKPSALLRNSLKNISEIPDLKKDLIQTTVSIMVGYLSKKVLIGATHNPLKQLLGTVLQIGVSSMVSKNADGINNTFHKIYNMFKHNVKEPVDDK